MRYRKLGKSDLEVSEIGFGCMSLGTDHHENVHMLHQAQELGINFFDTADLYDRGENEISVGKAFAGRRDRVIIATKVGNQWRSDGSGWDWNPRKAYIKSAVHDSLRRLQTDYIDLYQLHGGTLEDPVEETIEAFEELKAEGHIRWYGISSIRPNVIRKWVQDSGMVSVMTQYSLLDRRPEEETLDLLHRNGIGVVVRGAVAKGLLIDKAPRDYLEHGADAVAGAQAGLQELAGAGRPAAHLALRYVLAHPAVATIAAGASTAAQLRENAAAGEAAALSQEALTALRRLAPALRYEQHR